MLHAAEALVTPRVLLIVPEVGGFVGDLLLITLVVLLVGIA